MTTIEQIARVIAPSAFGISRGGGWKYADREPRRARARAQAEEAIAIVIRSIAENEPGTIRTAYRQGWSDREEDFMLAIRRIYPEAKSL